MAGNYSIAPPTYNWPQANGVLHLLPHELAMVRDASPRS
jgi:hypothetical protein